MAEVYEILPAVMGPEREAKLFARLWASQHGVRARAGMRLRIYQLEEVQPLDGFPGGFCRSAECDDVELVARWIGAFIDEAGPPMGDPMAMAESKIRERTQYLWVDEEPASMAGWTGGTPNGVRISLVYTPPELRGRGYATACVSRLSAELLARGFKLCFLYTDLSNPTSNSIYQRIGYRPVCDVCDIDFGPR